MMFAKNLILELFLGTFVLAGIDSTIAAQVNVPVHQQGERLTDAEDALRRYTRIRIQFRLAPFLPDPITFEELERYGDILSLSTDQAVFLDFAYRRYLLQLGAIADPELKDLLVLSNRARGWPDIPRPDADDLDQNVEYLEKREDVISRLVDAEDQLFAYISSVLTIEQQSDRLPRVILHRKRWRWRMSGQMIPASRIDVARMVEESIFHPSAMVKVERVLFKYEQAVTPLFEQLAKEYSQRQLGLRRADVERAADATEDALRSGNEGTALRRERYLQQRREALRTSARLQEEIREVNQHAIDEINAVLGNEISQELVDRYLDMAYGVVYPDKTNPDQHVHRILLSPHLIDDERVLIETLWETQKQRHERLCRQMCREYDAMWEALTADDNCLIDCQQILVKLRDLLTRRHDLNAETIEKIRSVLPPSVAEEFKDDLNRYLARNAKQRQADLTASVFY